MMLLGAHSKLLRKSRKILSSKLIFNSSRFFLVKKLILVYVFIFRAQNRQKIDMEKMKNERIRYMKNYKKNQEILLSKPEQITIMSEIIEMSKKVNYKL